MKTILVCGHGSGISDAVARRFGREGFAVGLVARNAERLGAAVSALAQDGVRAAAFPCDLSDPAAVTRLIADARARLGPLTVLHWNAYTGGAGDLAASDPAGLRRAFDVAVTGLVAAVQAALPDLKAQERPAVLVTGGGFAYYVPEVDAMAVRFQASDLAISKAAQHKLVGQLAARLGPEGVYVGEVVVTGMVKGTAFDHGNATLEPAAIAERFWELYAARAPLTVNFG